MAEPQKTSSSAVDSKSKEKISVLDEEIGKDFLSSWKSTSVTQDDAMDFNFDTISKGKKKPFNFDKLDMDFNLDGDFDKLSSFKIDMPDLDFASPSKKNAKAKEKSKEETNSGKQQEKKDRFTFSFDFNELDGFDFDSSLTKGEKTCKKSPDGEAAASESSEVPKIDQALEDDCITAKLPASRDGTDSNSESSKGGTEDWNSIDDFCLSKAVPLLGLVPGNLVAAQGSRISVEKTMDSNAKETYKSPLSDRAVSSELYDQKSLQSSPMDSLSGNNSNQETVSDMQAEVCSRGRIINASLAAEHNVSDKMITNEVSIHEKLHSNNSFPLSESDRDDRKGTGGNTLPEIDDSQSAKGDIILKDISTASLSREILDNVGAEKDIRNQTPKLPLVSLDSEPTITKLTARKDKEAGPIRSRFFRRSEETKSQLHQPSATGKEVSSFSRKKIGDMHLCSANEQRDDIDGCKAQNGINMVGYSKLSSQELTKGRPVLLQSENNVESSSDIRDGFSADADAGQNGGSKLIGKSSMQDTAATKGEPVLLRRPVLLQSENNVESSSDIRDGFNADADAGQNGGSKLIGKSSVQDTTATKGEPVLLRSEKNASARANPPNHAEKTTESGRVNPKPQVPKVESIQNSKFLSEALEIAKKAPALSSSKITRIIGPNKDQLNSKSETNPLRNLQQNKDTPGNTSKIVLPVGNAEKLTPKLPSLKRKTFEESKGDLSLLKSLKRSSQSISESRNLKESSERVGVAAEEVQNHKNHIEDSTKVILCDHLNFGSEVPREVNMTELEKLSVVETDGNVEKAEAYGKELEDICNMLKKKHEEAKELLVRAIVNNNNLLMLNHPIFKEKIDMVQKFAELLISKEMPT